MDMTLTQKAKVALVERLLDNGIEAFLSSRGPSAPEPTLNDFLQHVSDTVRKDRTLTAEECHRLATAPLPQIRVFVPTYRGAGTQRFGHLVHEDGSVPKALRLDEMDGGRS